MKYFTGEGGVVERGSVEGRMASVSILTQGCSANQSDSEAMAGVLEREGFFLIDDPSEADVVVVNTCTVKGPTEAALRRILSRLDPAKVVLAGCVPQADPASFTEYARLGPGQLDKVAEAARARLEGKALTFLGRREEAERLSLPSVRRNRFVEVVPIAQGCLSACAFCKTKHARGALRSYPVDAVVRRVSGAVAEGAREVWLTSQDCGAYGKDKGSSLAELLRAVLTIPRKFKIRVGMANPEHCKGMIDELISAFRDERVYKFLHVPVQAGSERVVRAMRRGHTVDDFTRVVAAFRKVFPRITIATDIICGYPGETREDFEETLSLVHEVRPDVVNISRFWPRPGTPAARLRPLPGWEVKRRSGELTSLFQRIALENNKQWMGWEGGVLFTEKGKEGTVIGRNDAYKQVVVRGGEELLGKRKRVRVEEVSSFDVRGRVIGAD
ncbi:tRNA (N(6)-L-threonylcarbamoyladenosine(37)-C(2))-methylthiotransferase [Candidatus Woesearchaeota archaeon]|nr:MAG: tRNA (N(6)-L-threonylcarbamoyladenosine(37)-C(2))-methylthiotransferase [Candidatus Woesearchaeota archaeon]